MFASAQSLRLLQRVAGPGLVATTTAAALSLGSGAAEARLAQRGAAAGTQRLAGRAARALATSAKPTSSGGFVPWYESHLARRPVLTKAVTGCCLWGIGDAVAQRAPNYLAPTASEPRPYDWARTGRACLFGFAIHAPLSHLHYNFLEWMTVRGGFKGLQIPVFKTIMEQFVYWSWFSNALYHGAMGAMQGQTPQQSWDYIKSVLWETQKAQWVFWIPVQLLNFNFVPVRHQLNVVLCTSIVWTALLSMWYPPIADDDAAAEKARKDLAQEMPVM